MTEPRRRSLRFLITPWWIGVIVTVLLFAAACWMILAPWQFRRNSERQAQIAAVVAAVGADPVPVDEFLRVGEPPAKGSTYRQASATGTFETDRQVYVRLRQDNDGNPAAEVLVPFRLDDGTVLVLDRGYVSDDSVRQGLAAPDPPVGRVTITGRAQPDQPDPSHRAPVKVHGLSTAYGIEPAAIAGAGEPVRDGFLELVDGSPGVLTAVDVPQSDEGPFLSYAWQWSAFGVMALLAVGYFAVREYTDPRDESDDEEPPPEQEPVAAGSRPRRRGSFDKSELYD